MLGLGETYDEVVETMEDLRAVGCQVVTLGQYLQPTPTLPSLSLCIQTPLPSSRPSGGKWVRHVESGPLVRSSYHAEKHVL